MKKFINKYGIDETIDSFDISKNWNREDIPEKGTWDLSFLFADDEAWEQAFEEIKNNLNEADKYQGKLSSSADALLAGLEHYEKTVRQAEKVIVYSNFKHDQNQADSKYVAMKSKASQYLAQLAGKLAFMQPELVSIEKETYDKFIRENDKLKIYKHYFDQILRQKAHTLSNKEETLLAQASDILDTSSEVFAVFSNADLEFPTAKVKDEDVRITQANFVPLLENKDRKLRQEVYEKYYATYKQYENTLALTLQKEIKKDNFNASVRGHKSARAAALYDNTIPEIVYDQLLNTISEHYDLLHRYVHLRKEKLNLETLHGYDLYTSMVDNVDFKFKPSEAKEIVIDALKPLGEKYGQILEKAFDERWIDWFSNKGKRSGAYSAGSTYDSKPYMLLNWQGTLDAVYTLAHELGHSMHSYFANGQPYIYSDYSIFLAEIASTTNENLLTEYLLQHEKDPKRKKYIINHYLDGFKGTVFRQSQFAKFEHLIHQSDQEGIALTADYLNEQYGKINQEFYGPELILDQQLSQEWIRIPHFYYNYYVYQYATGFSAATSFASRILAEGKPATDQYLKFLKAGTSDYPIDVLKTSGLDMTTSEPIVSALKTFEKYLNKFEE